MKRRNLLAGIPLVATGFSGCLGGRTTEQNEINYEECTERDVVKVENLPSAAEDEVRAAIEDGGYETDGELVLTKIDGILQLYLEDDVNGNTIYYETTVRTDNGSTRLFVEKTWPKHRGRIRIENYTEIDLTADLRVEHEGDLFLEKSVDIRAGEDIQAGEKIEVEAESDYRWGEHYGEVSVENDGKIYSDDETWNTDDWRGNPHITISPGNDEIRINMHDINEDMYPPGECTWNKDGELNGW